MLKDNKLCVLIFLLIAVITLGGCGKQSTNKDNIEYATFETEESIGLMDSSKDLGNKREFLNIDSSGEVELKFISEINFKEVKRTIKVDIEKLEFNGKFIKMYANVYNGYGEEIKLYHDSRQFITVENKGKTFNYVVNPIGVKDGKKKNIPSQTDTKLVIEFLTTNTNDIMIDEEIKLEITLDFTVAGFELYDTSVKIEVILNEKKEDVVFVPIDKDIEFHENAYINIEKYDENKDGRIDKFEYEKYLNENPDDLNGNMFRELRETIIGIAESNEVVINEELERIFEDRAGESLQELLNEHPLYIKYYEIKKYVDKNNLTIMKFKEWDKIKNTGVNNNNQADTKPTDKPTLPASSNSNNGMTQKEIDDAKKMSDDFMKDALNWNSGTGGNGSLEEYQKPFDPVN